MLSENGDTDEPESVIRIDAEMDYERDIVPQEMDNDEESERRKIANKTKCGSNVAATHVSVHLSLRESSHRVSQLLSNSRSSTLSLSNAPTAHQAMIIDGAEHAHVKKLLDKIEVKFKKCDEHKRDSLSKEDLQK